MITQGGAFIGRMEAAIGTPPTITVYDRGNTTLGTAWVVPLIESISVTPGVMISGETVNYSGDVAAVHWAGEYYEMQIRVKPFGSLLANAIKSAHFLGYGFSIVTAGFIEIPGTPFADLLNVTSGDPGGNRWLYYGAPLDLSPASGPAGKTITLRRYPKIVGTTCIVS